MAVSAITALLIVAPWLTRNTLTFGRFVPMRSNFGLELLQGNNPAGSVRQTTNSVHPMVKKKEFDRFEEMGEMAYMQWAFEKATEFIKKNPGLTAARVGQRIYVTWCTDILDKWSWRPDRKWWDRGFRAILLNLTTTVTAVLLLAIVLFGITFGHLRDFPYKFLFISLFVFLPLFQYFTIASNHYSQSIRPWLAMLAVVIALQFRGKST
jgi:hypothetical protein